MSFGQLVDGYFILLLENPVNISKGLNPEIIAEKLMAGSHIVDINKTMLDHIEAGKEEIINFAPEVLLTKGFCNLKQQLTDFFARDKKLFENQFIRSDGSKIWFESSYNEISNKKGYLRGIFAVHRDITPRKKALNALKESEERYQKLATFSFEGIVLHKNESIIDVNDSFVDISKYMRKELVGKNILELIPTKYHDNLVERLAKDTSFAFESELVTKYGKILFVEIESRNIVYKGEELNVLAIRDISSRKKTENALKESEEKYRTLVTNIPGVIYRCSFDANFTMQYISNAIETITGYESYEFIDNKIRTFSSIIHPDDHERVFETIKMGVDNFKLYTVEYRLLTKNNKIRWVTERGSLFVDENSGQKWLDGFIFDISDRVKVLEEFKKAKAAAEKANKIKSEFLANMSHEIRTPLNAILGFTELLENVVLEDIQKSYLESIKTSGKNLLTLINDILDLSKVEAGKLQLFKSFFQSEAYHG
ncbi:MAG: PAS domain S-box protein [Bacteroidales bacterium]|nr:PAS domain S-box protein [Bacteroidales bacterium]